MSSEIEYLRSTDAIRERAKILYDRAIKGESAAFSINTKKISEVAKFVAEVTRKNYPTLKVPYHSRWRHFEGPHSNRPTIIKDALDGKSAVQKGLCKFELGILSVLLDAGSGANWSYTDARGHIYQRSEGLAMASFDAWLGGKFAMRGAPLEVDVEKLCTFTEDDLAKIFQVSSKNPLLGLEGRVELIKRLGEVVQSSPHFFGGSKQRLGHLFDFLASDAKNGSLEAGKVLKVILNAFSNIWPGRIELEGQNLGDVWRHSAIVTKDGTNNLMPIHKLSQWLTYSLFEPLEQAGIKVRDLHQLTGLAEYRNGGLFIDMGVLVPTIAELTRTPQRVESEPIVEWRALTVALLDIVAQETRKLLGKNEEALPLASILQGGTWSAGREIAKKLRPDTGEPPIRIVSDGTTF